MDKISEKSKKIIDSLSREELVYEINLGNRSRFQREKFAYLKTRLDEISSREPPQTTVSDVDKMTNPSSWKEKFENHPVIFGFALILMGFLAGLGVSEWSFQFRSSPSSTQNSDSNKQLSINSIAKQIEILTSEHNSRLSSLHEELKKNEQQSVYGGHLDSSQQKYVKAAERIRASITEENTSYSKQLDQLLKIVDTSRD